MLTTEADAKTKRCHASFAASAGISHDGGAISQAFVAQPLAGYGGWGTYGMTICSAPLMCLGSACMAWRWGKLINVYTPCDPATNNGAGFIQTQEPGGYCGLAGMPIAVDKVDPQ